MLDCAISCGGSYGDCKPEGNCFGKNVMGLLRLACMNRIDSLDHQPVGFRHIQSSTALRQLLFARQRLPPATTHRIIVVYWCPRTCSCAQLNGKHDADTISLRVLPPQRKSSVAIGDWPSLNTTVRCAWEGEAVRLASPDTGQDRWECCV